MGTKNTATATAKTTAKTAKRYYKAHRLSDAAGSKLIVSIAELKDGKFRSAVAHRVDKKTQRAMVEVHATKPEAEARAERLIADAIKLGWVKKAPKAPKPPAFVELPKPVTTKPVAAPAKPITPIRKSA